MIAPFETQGRFKGGITSVATDIINNNDFFIENNIEIVPFSNCFVARNYKTMGKLSLKNVANFLIYKKELKKKVRETDFDAIYIHTSVKNALLKDLIVAKHFVKKYKVYLHIHSCGIENILPKNKILRKTIIKFFNKKIKKIIFLSSSTQQEFVNLGLNPDKSVVIYNFINKFPSKHSKGILSVNSGEKINLLYLASISKSKGIIDLLKAVGQLDRNIVLNIAGSINNLEIEEEFNQLIALLGDKVKLHGYVSGEEKEKLLSISDILVLPSYWEGMPVSVIEAMSHGQAVIATDVGALPEMIGSENLIKPGDVKTLTEKIRFLIDNPSELLKRKKENYLNSRDYSADIFMEKFVKALN